MSIDSWQSAENCEFAAAHSGAAHLGIAAEARVGPYVPPPACPTDLNQSGATDAADLAALLSNWGGTGTGDVNGSGTIDAADLAALLSAWGACP